MRGLLSRGLAALAMSVVVLAAGATPCRAEPAVTETTTYYDVTGATPEEVTERMHGIGPVDKNENKHFSANTRWFVRWHYVYRRNGDGCSIGSVSTTVTVDFTLPRLVSDDSALKAAFDRYETNLLMHERGHAAHGIDAARKIERAIADMQPMSDCTSLGAAANDLGQGLLRDANRQDIDYDAATQHGRSQGAHFP